MTEERYKPVFTVDHAKMLSEAILCVNRKYWEALERQAIAEEVPRLYTSTSPTMEKLMHEWQDEVRMTCQRMIGQMSHEVAHFQRLASQAVNCMPMPIMEMYPQSKPGETIVVVAEEKPQ